MAQIKLDFSKHPAAQDMICLIQQEKGFTSPEQAVDYAITPEMFERTIKTGWGSIALPIWGHDDPERLWNTLAEPKLTVELADGKVELIKLLKEAEKITMAEAVSYFLLFTMEALGYHI